MVDVARLKQIVGEGFVITDRERMLNYLYDESVPAVRPEAASDVILLKPGTSAEIAEVLRLANADGTPVFVRGGGTGLCGGSIPTKNGLLISMERFDRVIEMDADNLMVTVEAGVTLGGILKAADEAGLIFPPHPGDEGAQAGGMVALNAGGSRAVKHGVIRNYVKGLEAVLPTGEIVQFGGKLLKNNQGFDLLQLMINSSGLLGIITSVTLRLYPKPAASATLVVSFDDRYAAIEAVPRIIRGGIIPLAVEYFEHEAIDESARRLGINWPVQTGTAYLMIIIEGSSEDELYAQAEKIAGICEEAGAVDTLIAESREKQDDILKARSALFPSFQDRMGDTLDITVPPASVGRLLQKVDAVAKKYGTPIPTYGHAADGNLHAHIMKDLKDRGVLDRVKREIYSGALELGGVITGEHGIGQIRNKDLDLIPGTKQWEIMWGIKRLFDPNGILNPGVGLPPEQGFSL